MPSPDILVIVSGSIAAIKAPATLRRLREHGYTVSVVATRAALQFVTELSLSTAAAANIATDHTWFAAQPDAQHLTLAQSKTVLVIGASADLLARAAQGQASDLASATLLSVRGPVLWVPAMNEKMWLHPAVQRNVQTLRNDGQLFLGPETGSFGTHHEGSGIGRMSEPEEIVAAMQNLLEDSTDQTHSAQVQQDCQTFQDLQGLHIVVSAGPTREYLDPVRFISNPSSGKMGFAVAEQANKRGAHVTLISGPVHLAPPANIDTVNVQSALEMKAAIDQVASEADIIVMTAAVADYRAAEPKTQKEPKTADQTSIELVPNPDILAHLGAEQTQYPERVLVGFAMETHAGVERAASKAKRKNADFILLNYPTQEGTAFGGDDNQVTLVRSDGHSEPWPRMSKTDVAERLLSEAVRLFWNKTPKTPVKRVKRTT